LSLWTLRRSIEVADISEPEVSIGASAILERTYGDDVVISGQVSDNWGIATIEWFVDDVLIRTNSGSDEGATVFNHLFNSSYSAGLHTITLKVTDNSGMVSEDTATIDLYDSTLPVIGTHQEEVNLQIGQTFRFEANVSDAESNNLLFSWDFDGNVDSNSDGDPRNDGDGFGDSVLWSYDASGPMTVVCQIENDAGLVSEFEVLVNVLSGNEGDELDLMQLGLMAAGLLIVVILIALLTWRFMSNRRLAAMIAKDDESEQPVSVAPSVDEQKAMWGGAEPAVHIEQPAQQVFGDFSSGMSGSTQGISTAMGEPEGEELDPDHPKKRMTQAQVLPEKSYPSSTKMTLSRERISITRMSLRLRKPHQIGLPVRTKLRSSNLRRLNRNRTEKFVRIALHATRSSRSNCLPESTSLGRPAPTAARLNQSV